MMIDGISFGKILSYYPVYDAGNSWWIAYTLVGIFASLIWGSILKKGFWGNILKRIYVVS